MKLVNFTKELTIWVNLIMHMIQSMRNWMQMIMVIWIIANGQQTL